MSDSSVNSDLEYMDLDLNEFNQSEGGRSNNDLIVKGPVDYETYCFMRDWLSGMSEAIESLGAISSSSPMGHQALKA